MVRIVVPVRYPLTEHSKRTLERAVEIADERSGELTILHINLYQTGHKVTRTDLKSAVERSFRSLPPVRYVVRKGFLVEESILEEVAAEAADVVVIGHKQAGRWRRMLRKLVDDPDIEAYLREHLDCELIVAS